MAEETNVKIGADTEGLASGLKEAESTVDSSATIIQTSLQKMTTDVTGSIGKMQSDLQKHFAAIGDSIQKVTSVFIAAAGIMAGGKVFKDVIEETIKWTGEAGKLSKQLGITTEEASILNVALAATRNTTDTMSVASSMITRTLRTNEAAFKALHVETRDGNGNYRTTLDLMMDVNSSLSKLKGGIDQNAAGMAIYGRKWDEVRGLVRLTESQLEHAKKRAEELHLIVGPEGIKQMAAYKQAQVDMKETMHSVEIMIGNAVMPTLIQLGAWFNSIGPQSVEIFKGALNGIITFFQYVVLGAITLYETLKWVINNIITSATTLANVFSKIMDGDFRGAWESAKAGWKEAGDTSEQTLKRITTAANSTNDAVAKLWGLKKTNTQQSIVPDGEHYDAAKEPKNKKSESRISAWEADLEEIKMANKEFWDDDIAGDRNYWSQLLATADLSAEERIAIRRKLFEFDKKAAHEALATTVEALKIEADAALRGGEERIAIAERTAAAILTAHNGNKEAKEYQAALREIQKMQMEHEADQRKRADMLADHLRELSNIETSIERDKVNNLKAIGALSDSQAIAAETDLLAKEQANDRNALETKLANARQGSVEEQQLMNQLEAMQARHAQQMGQLNMQAANAASKPWRDMITGIGQAFQNTITNMIMYGGRFGDIMRKLSIAVVGAMVSGFVKMGVEWAQQQIMMTLFGQTQEQARVAARAAAAAETYGVTAMRNVALTTSETAVASMGAASAVAPIPIVGPAMAAAAAAEMSALGAGYIAMASAAGGYDIPSGINPVVQTHANEMILPANLAEKVRNMTDSPQQTQQSMVNFHISALDAKSVKKFFREHGQALADSLGTKQRNFAFGRG